MPLCLSKWKLKKGNGISYVQTELSSQTNLSRTRYGRYFRKRREKSMWVIELVEFGTEPGPKSEVRTAIYCEAVVPRGGGWGARSRSNRVGVEDRSRPIPVSRLRGREAVNHRNHMIDGLQHRGAQLLAVARQAAQPRIGAVHGPFDCRFYQRLGIAALGLAGAKNGLE